VRTNYERFLTTKPHCL